MILRQRHCQPGARQPGDRPATGSASATTGSTSEAAPSRPETGSIWSHRAKTSASAGPVTKVGIAVEQGRDGHDRAVGQAAGMRPGQGRGADAERQAPAAGQGRQARATPASPCPISAPTVKSL